MTSTLLRRALISVAGTGIVAVAGLPSDVTAAPSGVTKACVVLRAGSMDCYDSEAAMHLAHPELDSDEEVQGLLSTARTMAAASIDGGVVAAAACTGQLKLYTGANYTGTLYTYTQSGSWINLGTGANNAVSSYKIGTCAATFRENASGGGLTYPGSTAAGVNSPSMATGWDNRISSIA